MRPHRRSRSCANHFIFQFAVLMWLLTYVGALFNGLTLLLMGKERRACSVFLHTLHEHEAS